MTTYVVIAGAADLTLSARHSSSTILRRECAVSAKPPVETGTDKVHSALMADPEAEPVMLPFHDQVGPGWHVIIRYHAGHERRIDGFASEKEALDWIIANSKQVDK
jgi:hypothetical protein